MYKQELQQPKYKLYGPTNCPKECISLRILKTAYFWMYKEVKNAAQEDAPGTDHLIVLFRNVKDKPLKIDFVTLTKTTLRL